MSYQSSVQRQGDTKGAGHILLLEKRTSLSICDLVCTRIFYDKTVKLKLLNLKFLYAYKTIPSTEKYLCLGEMTAIVGELTTIFLGCGGNAYLGVEELTT